MFFCSFFFFFFFFFLLCVALWLLAAYHISSVQCVQCHMLCLVDPVKHLTFQSAVRLFCGSCNSD